MVQVNRKDDENVESLIRRFKKKILQSGVVFEARKRRYFEKKKSREQQKVNAIRRSQIRDEKEYLKKIGKLETKFKKRY